eukprot:TRINITY_DN24045_c0_g1_i1.p1 TRINITY_DN24045_c0_g1~~TRINITY_DN24045_c0_g1_i1.p1  ORF type:complete len:821 (+),score=189.49 TRINITY_DN24045_c0_g1_i1:58-2520(+)
MPDIYGDVPQLDFTPQVRIQTPAREAPPAAPAEKSNRGPRPVTVHKEFRGALGKVPTDCLYGYFAVRKVTRRGAVQRAQRLLVLTRDHIFLLSAAGQVVRIVDVADVDSARVKQLSGGEEALVLIPTAASGDPAMHVEMDVYDPRNRPSGMDAAGIVHLISELRARRGLPPTDLSFARYDQDPSAGVCKAPPKQYRRPSARLRELLATRADGLTLQIRRSGGDPLGLVLDQESMRLVELEPGQAASRALGASACLGNRLVSANGVRVRTQRELRDVLKECPGDVTLGFSPDDGSDNDAARGPQSGSGLRTLRVYRKDPQEPLGLWFDPSLVMRGVDDSGAASRCGPLTAELEGLQLRRVAGQPVFNAQDIKAAIGDSLEIAFEFLPLGDRDTLGDSETSSMQRGAGRGEPGQPGSLTVVVNRRAGQPLGFNLKAQGDPPCLVAHGVVPGSAAAEALGDRSCCGRRLLTVAGRPVTSIEDLRNALADNPTGGVAMCFSEEPDQESNQTESTPTEADPPNILEVSRWRLSGWPPRPRAGDAVAQRPLGGPARPGSRPDPAEAAAAPRRTCRGCAALGNSAGCRSCHAPCELCGGVLCAHDTGRHRSVSSWCALCGAPADGTSAQRAPPPLQKRLPDPLPRTLSQLPRRGRFAPPNYWDAVPLLPRRSSSVITVHWPGAPELDSFRAALEHSQSRRDAACQVEVWEPPAEPSPPRGGTVDAAQQTPARAPTLPSPLSSPAPRRGPEPSGGGGPPGAPPPRRAASEGCVQPCWGGPARSCSAPPAAGRGAAPPPPRPASASGPSRPAPPLSSPARAPRPGPRSR